jgi:hypothetical protein
LSTQQYQLKALESQIWTMQDRILAQSREVPLSEQLPQTPGQHAFLRGALPGKRLPICFDEDTTIGQIKQYVYEQVGVPTEEQMIVYAGRQLEDRHTLGFYNVSNGSDLQLMLRGLGGAPKTKKAANTGKGKDKDKGARMVELARLQRARMAELAQAMQAMGQILPSIDRSIAAFNRTVENGRGFEDILAGLSEEALDKVQSTLSSNNQDYKISVLAKEFFAPQYADLTRVHCELKSADELMLLAVETAFDRRFFLDTGSYDMKAYEKLVSDAVKAKAVAVAAAAAAVGRDMVA